MRAVSTNSRLTDMDGSQPARSATVNGVPPASSRSAEEAAASVDDAVWETDPALAAQSDLMSDYAKVWQGADKVYSTTLAAVSTARTRLERHFEPDAVRDLKSAASHDLLVGGLHLAAQALKAGLVDGSVGDWAGCAC